MTYATAPPSACTLAQARPTMSCIRLVICSLYTLFRTSYRKSPPALILRVLASFVNSKTIHKLLRKDTNRCPSSMATARTETTRGPTYSMKAAVVLMPRCCAA